MIQAIPAALKTSPGVSGVSLAFFNRFIKIAIHHGSEYMLCFIHIERAGGTTLHYILRNNMISYLTLTPWLHSTNEAQNHFKAVEAKWLFKILPFSKGFGGHTTRCYLGYENVLNRNVNYITFLRDPISRYISHFHYQKKVMQINWTLDTFLEEKRFHNFMTVRIAGTADLERAILYLEEKFRFVGLTERFDESLILMKHELGLDSFDPCYEVKNAISSSSLPAAYERIDRFREDCVIDHVVENNQLDIGLYEYAKNVLYPRYRNRFGPDLQREVESLAKSNESYSFSKKRRITWAAYRWAVYRNIEYLIACSFHSDQEFRKKSRLFRIRATQELM